MPLKKKISPAWWIILAVVAAVVMFARLRMLDLPLERDEGEFAVIGGQILSGIAPYAESYNLKPPGIYMAYAAIMAVFGETAGGIHLGLLLINILTAVCLFFFTRKSWGERVAALSTACFLVLSLSPRVLGLSAHATHFVLLPAIAGLALLGAGVEKRNRSMMLASGVLMGLSVLMKQPGVFFVLMGAVVMLREFFKEDPNDRLAVADLLVFLTGVAAPIIAVLAWMMAAGVWERFWFWTVTYGFAYGSRVGIAEGIAIASGIVPTIVYPAFIIWVVAAGGIIALRRRSLAVHDRLVVIFFLVLSFLAVTTGFLFRRHYFILMLPAIAVFFALGVEQAGEFFSSREKLRKLFWPAVLVLTITGLGQPLFAGREVLFSLSPDQASREMFGMNPFVESERIAARVREMTGEEERILVFGSEPQIYFYAERPPATGYLYTYSLMEDQPYAGRMQEELIAQVERSRPGVLLFVNVPWSWLVRPESDMSVIDWFFEYRQREGYELAGIVDIVSMTETVWRWGPDAAGYTPASKSFIEVWRLAD